MNENITVSDESAKKIRREVVKYVAVRLGTAIVCTVATTLIASALEKKLNPSDEDTTDIAE